MSKKNNKLKAYIMYDGDNRAVPSSVVHRAKMPKVGKWVEIPMYYNSTVAPTTTTTTTAPATTTTTTTANPINELYVLYAFNEAGAGDLCNDVGEERTVYSDSPTLDVGDRLYKDTDKLVNANAGWYVIEGEGGLGTSYLANGIGLITGTYTCG